MESNIIRLLKVYSLIKIIYKPITNFYDNKHFIGKIKGFIYDNISFSSILRIAVDIVILEIIFIVQILFNTFEIEKCLYFKY